MAYKQDKWINGLQVDSMAYNANSKNGFNTRKVRSSICLYFTEVQLQQCMAIFQPHTIQHLRMPTMTRHHSGQG